MRGSETQIFEGKTLSELLKDIYDISAEKRGDIKALISVMGKMVTRPDDVINIGPVIQQYFEVSVKNDDQLAKIAQIVQRMVSAEAQDKASGDPADMLTEEEKHQLLLNATHELKTAKNEIEDTINSLPTAIKNK